MIFHHKRLHGRLCCIVIICFFIILYLIIFKSLPDSLQTEDQVMEWQKKQALKFTGPLSKGNIAERLTIVIREFEDFDNALVETVDAIKIALGNVPILIVADRLPYPPVKLDAKSSAHLVTLSSDLTKNYSTACVSELVKTQYVLIIPDAVKLKDVKQIKTFVAYLRSKRNTRAVAIPLTGTQLQCHDLDVDLKRWVISFQINYTANTFYCPLVKGSHGLLMESETFKSLAEPFARPFPFTFYFQSKLKNWWTRVMKSGRLDVLADLYKEPHSAWKHKKGETDRLHTFYHTVGIKQELSANGVSRFFGCDKNTPRCFGTVINDMPDYLYQGRWTPPCCLKALREISAHVFSVLEQCKVRYWLEGGSLLGAVRHKDIIPWDYDVDIGIYKDDIENCVPLTKAKEEQYVDEEDFVWEKAKEGEFFRVQYSEINHLHVDIYPFYSKDGVMTKDTWFLTHRQDTEFPEKFVTELTKMEFAGVMASVPKNVREFLEFKFGEGVIEHPKYPNLQDPR